MAQEYVETALTGFQLISDPLLNKGTAFTEEERDAFALHGLLPPHVGTLDDQVARRIQRFRRLAGNFEKYAFLRDLLDHNETLFYALVIRHMEEMLPIVYTPTVGEGCQRFSEIWRRPNGLFLSYPNRHRIGQILSHPRYDSVRCIVVSDGERILGLGDQGAGGMGIPIGKLSLYTALAGIAPPYCLPVLLDVGTDNEERLADPLYVGWSHHRIRGQEYDEFIETFVSAVEHRWPNVLLQWEDFANRNAARLLERYRDRLCTFNDDIQGTAAVATAVLLAAANVTKVPLTSLRVAVLGFGSAGMGIASLLKNAMVQAGLNDAEARARFYPVGLDGLMVEGDPGIEPAQAPWARTRAEISGWKLEQTDRVTLFDVMQNAQPNALIGTSGAAGAFTERIVRAMAAAVERPAIFPLSNPTSHSEAVPDDLLQWTGGRAVVGTGSPFPNVDQTNNSYIFPGLALGILASNARRVTDGMFMAAARALAALSPSIQDDRGRLLPPVTDLRRVAVEVAIATARQAAADGVADPMGEPNIRTQVLANVWEPEYLPYRRRV